MRKAMTLLALAGVVSQVAVMPALAADPFNFSGGPLGWGKQSSAAVMAYVRVPLGVPKTSSAMPRAGFKITGPRTYGLGQSMSHLANPTLVDFGVTGRSFNAPWTATLNLGNTVTWASNPAALPKETPKLRMFGEDSGISWIVVGALTVAAGVGIFAAIDK
jgi:hypothetical protein